MRIKVSASATFLFEVEVDVPEDESVEIIGERAKILMACLPISAELECPLLPPGFRLVSLGEDPRKPRFDISWCEVGSTEEVTPSDPNLSSMSARYKAYIELDIPNAEFCATLNRMLVVCNLSEETLAKDLRVTKATVSRWVSGKAAPHPALWETIYRYLDRINTGDLC